jgi:LacI family transcriptional regulator
MPAVLPKPPRVALVIEASNAYGRGLLEGILRHVREHEPWQIFLPEHGRGLPPLEALARWRGDGIIARIESGAIASAIRRLRRSRRGLSIIDVSAARLLPDVPYVETDDEAIARAAVDHFLDRHFRHFAFLGDPRFRWSVNRRQAFMAAAGKQHRHVATHDWLQVGGSVPAQEELRLAVWLKTLPRPVGLFASYDILGRHAIDACRQEGLSIPDDVAVLGVDDDPLLCGLTCPPLSSIIPDAVGAGRLAAELLEQRMRGGALSRHAWLLPPLGISTRQSTDVLAIDDPLVIQAVGFIRSMACRGIRVADVVCEVATSRRLLEQRFQRAVGRTLHEEIIRVQFARVEQLLRETDLPLATIATRAGFRHPEYLTAAFARRYGQPPSRWRRGAREA